jgi:inorganic pyrophosphatase/exopolyphosphatase
VVPSSRKKLVIVDHHPISHAFRKSPPYPWRNCGTATSSIAAQHGFLRRQLSRREGFKSGATW